MCNLSKDKCIHTKESAEKCMRSPSIFVMCVQYMRILMDHKGVCVQALTEGSVQGSNSLLDFVFIGPVKFVD